MHFMIGILPVRAAFTPEVIGLPGIARAGIAIGTGIRARAVQGIDAGVDERARAIGIGIEEKGHQVDPGIPIKVPHIGFARSRLSHRSPPARRPALARAASGRSRRAWRAAPVHRPRCQHRPAPSSPPTRERARRRAAGRRAPPRFPIAAPGQWPVIAAARHRGALFHRDGAALRNLQRRMQLRAALTARVMPASRVGRHAHGVLHHLLIDQHTARYSLRAIGRQLHGGKMVVAIRAHIGIDAGMDVHRVATSRVSVRRCTQIPGRAALTKRANSTVTNAPARVCQRRRRVRSAVRRSSVRVYRGSRRFHVQLFAGDFRREAEINQGNSPSRG